MTCHFPPVEKCNSKNREQNKHNHKEVCWHKESVNSCFWNLIALSQIGVDLLSGEPKLVALEFPRDRVPMQEIQIHSFLNVNWNGFVEFWQSLKLAQHTRIRLLNPLADTEAHLVPHRVKSFTRTFIQSAIIFLCNFKGIELSSKGCRGTFRPQNAGFHRVLELRKG